MAAPAVARTALSRRIAIPHLGAAELRASYTAADAFTSEAERP